MARLHRFLSPTSAFAAVSGLIASGLVFASPASAVVACSAGSVSSGSQCVLAAGRTVVLLLKGGNGGNGGSGGAGGDGGSGWTGAAAVLGGDGGGGGTGGAGGAGAKTQVTYTNTSGSSVTLTFTIGSNGSNGAAGLDGTGGTNAATTPSVAADGVAGRSGNGGFGGDGGEDSVVMIGATTIASARGADGGSGGSGGVGGQGGLGSGSGTHGLDGAAGAAGSAAADATGGNQSTTRAEAPFIQLSFPASATSGSSAARPSAQTIDLALNADGGSCQMATVQGDATAWVTLPSVGDCRKPGAILAGWRPANSTVVYAPGARVELTSDNTLVAVWADIVAGVGGSTSSTGGSSAKPIVKVVVWNRNASIVRAGDPAALSGQRPVFSIATKYPRLVSRATVLAAKKAAAKYGGVYAGIVPVRSWRVPRIVATYID